MHLCKIEIKNYRNFHSTSFDFDEGLNVVVGPNNSGKSNLLNVIEFLHKTPNPRIDDLNKNILVAEFERLKNKPPEIEIKYTINHSLNFETPDSALGRLKDFLVYTADDGNLESSEDNETAFFLEAKILVKFQLRAEYEQEYRTRMKSADNFDKFYEILKSFSDGYAWIYFDCDGEKKDFSSVRDIFDIQYVDAVRNTEKIRPHTMRTIDKKINERGINDALRQDLNSKIKQELQPIVDEIDGEIDKDQDAIGILDGKNKFVSSFNFDRSFAEFFSYELKDDTLNYSLPLDHNGLGYNNLIEIRNLIKQYENNDFNILLIEEPESHLHPNMQYKLLKYISELKEIVEKKIKYQIIITTHSPNISASTKLENIILIDYERPADTIANVQSFRANRNFEFDKDNTNLNIARKDDESDADYNRFLGAIPKELSHAKKHLEKFLDITRSDLLFSQRIILAEGLAEKLLIPKFAEMLGKNLINNHVVIIEIGGITFNNFLPLFVGTNKKVLCFSDCDFKYVVTEDNKNKVALLDSYQSCIDQSIGEFFRRQYQQENFKLFTQREYGNTFETELFLKNYEDEGCFKYFMEYALPESAHALISHKSIQQWKDGINNISNAATKKKILEIVDLFLETWDTETDTNKKLRIEKIFSAYLFYQYIKDRKGDFSLKIASDENILLHVDEGRIDGKVYLKIPEYIKEGLEWLLQ